MLSWAGGRRGEKGEEPFLAWMELLVIFLFKCLSHFYFPISPTKAEGSEPNLGHAE